MMRSTFQVASFLILILLAPATSAADLPLPITSGGEGGVTLRITNLGNGPGSLKAALEQEGPRTIVFDVAGVIDLQKQTLVIDSPYITIAGESAPPPGITLVRGGLSIQSHDVMLRHLRIRPGEAGSGKGSGWDVDGVSTSRGAHRVIVDHCSFSWATDENLSASGPRFMGDSIGDWRKSTSHDIVFSHNIIAEGLANSTHSKLEHSKGMLLHDNVTGVLIYGNLFAHNQERNPLLKGGVQATMVNNLVYDPGSRAVHYNLLILEWGGREPVRGRLTAVGNVMRGGGSTKSGLPFLMIGGQGSLDFHGRDNLALDWRGQPLPLIGRYTTSPAEIVPHDEPLDWPEGLQALPSEQVEEWVLKNAGARPWDRDAHDQRIISNVAEGRGRIIDSEQDVGGYPENPSGTKP
jgi:hypothetical protein